MQFSVTQKNNFSFLLFALLQMLAVGGAAFYQQPLIIAIPFMVLALLVASQKLAYVFLSLIIAIPWSAEFNFNQSLGTDLPDEPLMWLTSFGVTIWILQHYKSILKKPVVHPIVLLLALELLWIL